MSAAPKVPIERMRDILNIVIERRDQVGTEDGLGDAEGRGLGVTLEEFESICQQAIDSTTAYELTIKRLEAAVGSKNHWESVVAKAALYDRAAARVAELEASRHDRVDALIASRDDTIEKLETDLADRDAEIARLDAAVNEAEHHLSLVRR